MVVMMVVVYMRGYLRGWALALAEKSKRKYERGCVRAHHIPQDVSTAAAPAAASSYIITNTGILFSLSLALSSCIPYKSMQKHLASDTGY